MHELQRVLERQVRELAGGVLGQPYGSTLDCSAEADVRVGLGGHERTCSHGGKRFVRNAQDPTPVGIYPYATLQREGSTVRRTAIVVPALIVGMVALVLVGGATAKKPALSATPVFKLHLKPSQEVPPIKGLKADAVGSVTFDLTRNAAGATPLARSSSTSTTSSPAR